MGRRDSGAVVQAFTTEDMVQVFLLAGNAATESLSGSQSAGTQWPDPKEAQGNSLAITASRAGQYNFKQSESANHSRLGCELESKWSDD